jgi:hypothetical protein
MEGGQGFGKRPERFRFQEDWTVDLSTERFWHFRNRGLEIQRTRGTLASRFPESRKSVAQSRKPFSAFWQPGVQERRSRETGSPDSRNHEFQNPEEKTVVMGRFRNSGVQEVEGPITVCSWNHKIVNSKISKRRLLSWVDFIIPGFGRLKDQEPSAVGIVKSRILKSRKRTVVAGSFRHFGDWELEGQGAWESSHAGVPKS